MAGHCQDRFAGEYEILKLEDNELAGKFDELCEIISGCGSALVAFSGGTDSALLAYLSSKLLDRCLCVTAKSTTISRTELSGAMSFASQHNLEFRIIDHNELDDARFCTNDKQRCFYCKDGLFKVLGQLMEAEGLEAVFDGSNHDDLDDYRPGRMAAQDNNVRSPLLEAGLGKSDIRKLSKKFCLETWDKPQMACLASRIPYSSEITLEKLAAIEKAEELVRGLGYRDVRVRHHGDIARIELGKDEPVDLDKLKSVVPQIKKLKFKYVVLDIEGYRTGSLNE
ncbi:MAG: ATP-dependent sacrificial sulfur transferase LarE [Thermoplasmata archaeon]|nr:ATP-dependent sacrificial sulfur transferase LarE [Thermoplasmata archaeon]